MTGKRRPSRRDVLLGVAGVGASIVAAPHIVSSRALGAPGRPGANERVHIGVIGVGMRGKYQIANVPSPGRVVAICDWYTPRMDFVLQPEQSSRYSRFLAPFREGDGKSCAKYQ